MVARTTRGKIMCFDTDAYLLLVDNGATACISNKTSSFISPLIPTHKRMKGIAGKVGNLSIGTIRWRIKDNEGVSHNILIPNSYYIRGAPTRLLLPQHWAQEAGDIEPEPNGTWCATYGESVVLHWNQGKHKRMI